jgi:hypothetical protein
MLTNVDVAAGVQDRLAELGVNKRAVLARLAQIGFSDDTPYDPLKALALLGKALNMWNTAETRLRREELALRKEEFELMKQRFGQGGTLDFRDLVGNAERAATERRREREAAEQNGDGLGGGEDGHHPGGD